METKPKRSAVLQSLLDEMESDPWHVKLRRWYRVERWILICRTRFIWDKNYQHNIFRKKPLNTD